MAWSRFSILPSLLLVCSLYFPDPSARSSAEDTVKLRTCTDDIRSSRAMKEQHPFYYMHKAWTLDPLSSNHFRYVWGVKVRNSTRSEAASLPLEGSVKQYDERRSCRQNQTLKISTTSVGIRNFVGSIAASNDFMASWGLLPIDLRQVQAMDLRTHPHYCRVRANCTRIFHLVLITKNFKSFHESHIMYREVKKQLHGQDVPCKWVPVTTSDAVPPYQIWHDHRMRSSVNCYDYNFYKPRWHTSGLFYQLRISTLWYRLCIEQTYLISTDYR